MLAPEEVIRSQRQRKWPAYTFLALLLAVLLSLIISFDFLLASRGLPNYAVWKESQSQHALVGLNPGTGIAYIYLNSGTYLFQYSRYLFLENLVQLFVGVSELLAFSSGIFLVVWRFYPFLRRNLRLLITAVFAYSAIILQAGFLWTSIFYDKDGLVTRFINFLLFYGYLPPTPEELFVSFDFRMLACAILSSFCVFFLCRRSMTRVVQYLSSTFVILGSEIYLFDRREFAIYVTSYQIFNHLALWVTNEFLTIASVSTLLVVSAFRYWKYKTI